MEIQIGKTYKTRAGDKVKLVHREPTRRYPNLGVVLFGNDRKTFWWNDNGQYTTTESSLDLIEKEGTHADKMEKLKEIVNSPWKTVARKLELAEDLLLTED